MLQMISILSKPKILDKVKWRWDGEENQIILLSKEDLALPLILNPTAARIFSLCNGHNSLEDMARIICDDSGIQDLQNVSEDIKKQIDYFLNKGIIQT